MFLEEYQKVFRLQDNDFLEKNSFNDYPLFSLPLEDLKDIFDNNYKIKVTDLNKYSDEVNLVIQKYKFINSYLQNYIDILKKESSKLDEEYLKINNYNTLKGNTLLNINELPNKYNHVLNTKIVEMINMVNIGEENVKTSNQVKYLDFFIEKINNESFFVNFNKPQEINSIFVEFYKNLNISIFGTDMNGRLINIANKKNSDIKFFRNTNKEMFTKILFLSKESITNYLKNVEFLVRSKQNKAEENTGYIIRQLKDINKYKSLLIASDDNSKFYLYTASDINNVLGAIQYKKGVNEFLNEVYQISANEEIDLTNRDKVLYLLEEISPNITIVKEPQIYTKEVK